MTNVEWNEMRLRYLFYLRKTEEKGRSISVMARFFGTSKSTISRNLEIFSVNGLVYRDSMRLTKLGASVAAEYGDEVDKLSRYLADYTRKAPEEMTAEAIRLFLSLEPDTRRCMIEKQRVRDFLRKLDNSKHPGAADIQKKLEDGKYHLPFTIYRESMEVPRYGYVSMSDMGFSHPAVLFVGNGIGTIYLKAVAIEKRSVIENMLLSGKAFRMEYLEGREYIEARREGDGYYFPLSSLTFTWHPQENWLQGSTKLMLQMPMKINTTHKRAAVFTLFFQ